MIGRVTGRDQWYVMGDLRQDKEEWRWARSDEEMNNRGDVVVPSPEVGWLHSFLSSSAAKQTMTTTHTAEGTRPWLHVVQQQSSFVVCVTCDASEFASRTKFRVLTWPVGCQAKQVDVTIPLGHACPCPQP